MKEHKDNIYADSYNQNDKSFHCMKLLEFIMEDLKFVKNSIIIPLFYMNVLNNAKIYNNCRYKYKCHIYKKTINNKNNIQLNLF